MLEGKTYGKTHVNYVKLTIDVRFVGDVQDSAIHISEDELQACVRLIQGAIIVELGHHEQQLLVELPHSRVDILGELRRS